MVVVYEPESRESVESILPPGVELPDGEPVCYAYGRWAPFSTLGPYHEAFLMIRVRFEGELYRYQPAIFVNNDVAMAVGREVYGTPKKMAYMRHHSNVDVGVYGEQRVYVVERPRGQRIITIAMTCDELADPTEREALPALTMKLIPNAEGNGMPSVAQLVRLDIPASLRVDAAGNPQLWKGRASLTMGTVSAVDPLHLFTPKRILSAYRAVFDFELPHGTVVHDYLTQAGPWNE